jgi:predicted MFS family arabinose efflux permease
MALALVATVTGRWFVARRGLVSGVLTAGGATGQLVFLPLVALVAEGAGWRAASAGVALAALAVIPLVLLFLRERPRDVGAVPYGGTAADDLDPVRHGAARIALTGLTAAARTGTFWLLAAGMAICGATTFGLVQPHFIPAAHDHGMPATTAAGLLALVGIFDIAGTIASGWLTDRVDPRLLLAVYYALRGVSLALLPAVLGPDLHASMVAFIVFYGLDWVATIPPTMALCREIFGARAPVVFGWVFATHQLGAALMALGAGVVRDVTGSYDVAWYVGGALGIVAAGLSLPVRRVPVAAPAPAASPGRV